MNVKNVMKNLGINSSNYYSYSHNRKYLESTGDFDINSSQNMREFYITDKGRNYIEDIDEATNYCLEEIKNCYQFRKVLSFKYKVTAECEYKKRTEEEVKTTKMFFNTDFIFNNAIYDYGDFKQWLDFEKEIYEGHGYHFEFLGIRSIQLNIEPTKASIGTHIDLPADLKNSKPILNIRSYKYNCLQLTITAWLHPVIGNAPRESKYVDKRIEPRQQHEDDFGYILRIKKSYNFNIWLYTPCRGGKVELFKQVDNFNKARKDVRILVWGINKDNSHKTGEDLTIEYLQSDVEILDYCMNQYVKLRIQAQSPTLCKSARL